MLWLLAASELEKARRKWCGPGSVVGIATGYGLDSPGIESRWRRDFPHLSRPALGPTQPPVEWVPGISRGIKRTGRGADPSPLLVPRSRKRVELYLYSPYGPSWLVTGWTYLMEGSGRGLFEAIFRHLCKRNEENLYSWIHCSTVAGTWTGKLRNTVRNISVWATVHEFIVWNLLYWNVYFDLHTKFVYDISCSTHWIQDKLSVSYSKMALNW
jgi:hypothetical protein